MRRLQSEVNDKEGNA